MLNNSGESGYPCLGTDLRGNAFSFSPFRIMFAVGLLYTAFTMLRWSPSVSFSSLIAVARTSRTMLNNSDESGCPCLVPDLSGNAFSFSPLKKISYYYCITVNFSFYLLWFFLLRCSYVVCITVKC